MACVGSIGAGNSGRRTWIVVISITITCATMLVYMCMFVLTKKQLLSGLCSPYMVFLLVYPPPPFAKLIIVTFSALRASAPRYSP
ncbi:uncharacterized protein B0H64DRAFT_123853 [Chaetomium fimeti]|uniref:Uncharacterized protein n=1 Tax=Chaetomium fimeti TaxID=1854472 RepID=A0AAE0HIZ9_9PEZI|nr:hypothetical protein B0H64DRAFT_123853 [Chaetomium fimeti]